MFMSWVVVSVRRQLANLPLSIRRAIVPAAVAFFVFAMPAGADVFSIDAISPSVTAVPVDPADLLTAGPYLHVPSYALGLRACDEIDALSAGADIVTGNDIIFFSVSRDSQGIVGALSPWDVYGQTNLGQVAGDTFVTIDQLYIQSAPAGANALDVNQHEFGLIPFGPTGLPMLPFTEPVDNLDAYSMEEFDFTGDGINDHTVFFSLAAGSPTLGMGFSPADILQSAGGVVSVAFDAALMGLDTDDDIDALALFEDPFAVTGVIGAYFSLAPGSPTLAGVDGVFATIDDLSAADVFFTNFTSVPPPVQYPGLALGLTLYSDIVALETNAIPEPTTLVLFALSAIRFIRRR